MLFRFVTKHACVRETDGRTGRQHYDPKTALESASRGKRPLGHTADVLTPDE